MLFGFVVAHGLTASRQTLFPLRAHRPQLMKQQTYPSSCLCFLLPAVTRSPPDGSYPVDLDAALSRFANQPGGEREGPGEHSITARQHFVPLHESDPFGLTAVRTPGEVRVETAWVMVGGSGGGGASTSSHLENEDEDEGANESPGGRVGR